LGRKTPSPGQKIVHNVRDKVVRDKAEFVVLLREKSKDSLTRQGMQIKGASTGKELQQGKKRNE